MNAVPVLESNYSYTRAQAIEDGEQVEAGNMAKEAGFKYPVYFTRAVWQEYIVAPEGLEGQDTAERLWDTLCALRTSIKQASGVTPLYFMVPYQLPSETRLRGYEAIKYAKKHNLTLCKYNDPIVSARAGLTLEEADTIDKYLIYVDREPAEKPQFETKEIQLVAVAGPNDINDPRPALTVMLVGKD
ncbi:hypothetical protein SPSYN_02951 [Sporotomaculum syntrophicum]|uniref:Uncharacterized protein n=1 Tax=Sporotomaculum syntrophicum TaxID=182264 RepID=A0A9D2WMK3_9FIRM|nr:DUF6573 family protein [Sporotomaculum syntrophicum]KAF1084039.1 hypothetical protein SPSYN_02951 [Sporotomaculum syntrophicum]